jgi:hypothetical protein
MLDRRPYQLCIGVPDLSIELVALNIDVSCSIGTDPELRRLAVGLVGKTEVKNDVLALCTEAGG